MSQKEESKTIFFNWNEKAINVRNDNITPLTPEIISQN